MRKLPIHYFGVRRFSKDGYNPCCKECRSFRRKRNHKNSDALAHPIFPLNEHNQTFLARVLASTTKGIFLGLDLQTLNPIQVFFNINEADEFSLTIQIENSATYTHSYQGKKDGFFAFVLPTLSRLKIRLFHSTDFNSLSNWGHSKHL